MPTPDVIALWLRNPIFAAAGESACVALAHRSKTKRHPAGTDVAIAGALVEHLHVLLDGAVRVYHQDEGGLEATVKLLRAPCVYGDIELFHDLPFLERVATLEDALIARVPRAEYERFLRTHPAAMFEHLRHMAAAFCVAARNEHRQFATLESRIASLLVAYTLVLPPHERSADQPAVVLTQESIARSLGVVLRSVAGILARWNKEGIVQKRGGRLVLQRVDHLERLGGPIAGSLPYWIGMPLGRLAALASAASDASVQILSDVGMGTRARIGNELVVGTHPSCGLVLAGNDVAQRHCRFFKSARGGRYWVQALSRSTTTTLGGRHVSRAVLGHGQIVEVGTVRLRVDLGGAAEDRDGPAATDRR